MDQSDPGIAACKKVSIWGCGNFECWWPGQILGNRRAEREGRLEVHPWADDRSLEDRSAFAWLRRDKQRRGAILRADWREKFETFSSGLTNTDVYVTIDMDCLRARSHHKLGERQIRGCRRCLGPRQATRALPDHCRRHLRSVLGTSLCALDTKFAANFDHPKLEPRPADEIRQINVAAVEKLWPALTGLER